VTDKWTVAECFGVNLARLKRERGLSLSDLSDRAGMHRTHIGLLLRGKRVARIDTVIKLASALSVPPGALLEGIAWEPPGGQERPGEFVVGPVKS
jgi:transcriptional regulator with XRE-family HTH domain